MREKQTYTEAQAELHKAIAGLRTTLLDTIPTWPSRHARWIQPACAVALLAFAAYLLWVNEPLSAAMFAGFVVYVTLRGLHRKR